MTQGSTSGSIEETAGTQAAEGLPAGVYGPNGETLSQRQARLRQAKLRRFDEEFQGKKFEVVREVHLPHGQVFVTKFGNKGRHGWVIRNRDTGEEMVVGDTVLKLIHDRYLGVTLPKRRRRTVPAKGDGSSTGDA